MKKIVIFALFVVISLCLPSVAAASGEYYLVEGYVTQREGEGKITRVELVDDVSRVETNPGDTFAICVYEEDETLIGSYGIGASFETAADLPFAVLDEARFSVLVPRSENIYAFALEDIGYYLSVRLLKDTFQDEIESFTAEEAESGYELSWEVALIDADEYPNDLDFDVYAISKTTGEKNVLAYRTTERSLTVPYEWLEPNDEFVFMLKSNDGYNTLTAQSEAFEPPDGESKSIVDTEVWQEQGEGQTGSAAGGGGGPWVYIIIAAAVIAVAAGAFVVMKKQKKPRS